MWHRFDIYCEKRSNEYECIWSIIYDVPNETWCMCLCVSSCFVKQTKNKFETVLNSSSKMRTHIRRSKLSKIIKLQVNIKITHRCMHRHTHRNESDVNAKTIIIEERKKKHARWPASECVRFIWYLVFSVHYIYVYNIFYVRYIFMKHLAFLARWVKRASTAFCAPNERQNIFIHIFQAQLHCWCNFRICFDSDKMLKEKKCKHCQNEHTIWMIQWTGI